VTLMALRRASLVESKPLVCGIDLSRCVGHVHDDGLLQLLERHQGLRVEQPRRVESGFGAAVAKGHAQNGADAPTLGGARVAVEKAEALDDVAGVEAEQIEEQ